MVFTQGERPEISTTIPIGNPLARTVTGPVRRETKVFGLDTA